ncbi:hypothetical protein ABZP36_029720 [Zizania latifolia]
MALPPAAMSKPAMPFASQHHAGGSLRRPSPLAAALRVGAPLFWPWQLLWGYQESMDNELQGCFNLALKNGITLFDTADSYGTGRLNGQSERQLGKFIREFEGPMKSPDDVIIATKFAAYPLATNTGPICQRLQVFFQFVCLMSSLERLHLDRLGIGQLHLSTANYAPLQERDLWDGLVEMYEKGLVRAVGVSNYGPKQPLKIHSYLASRGVPLSSAHVQFSLLSMGDEHTELKTVSVLFRQILPELESLLTSLKQVVFSMDEMILK